MSNVFVGTKEEAVEFVKRTIPGRHGMVVRGDIDTLIALGLWTPTEPKSVEDEAIEALTSLGYVGYAEPLFHHLKAAGFTVTKAVK